MIFLLTRGWVFREPNVSIYAKDLCLTSIITTVLWTAEPRQNTYYILDGQLWDRVIYRDQSLGHVLHKTMPVFFGLSEVWVVH